MHNTVQPRISEHLYYANILLVSTLQVHTVYLFDYTVQQ